MRGPFFLNPMKSFRTELEQDIALDKAIVEQDIIELEQKIHAFKNGGIDEERFRTLRLARGVYGQRQFGVQMIRMKIPFGRLTAQQLERIAAVSDEYSTGKLHITTRQDIQIHHVQLDRTPELWAELEKDDVTLREACGNTVRNITASAYSGIDPEEVFDVRSYADEVFKYFLRNPICQEMGRKFKMSFSNSTKDTALAYMHDLGFIAEIQGGVHGFKVMVGGGLGSQSRQADILFEFLPIDRVIPVVEASLRLFDRHGERANRMKARLKFWLKSIGIEEFKVLLEKELEALVNQLHPIDYIEPAVIRPILEEAFTIQPEEETAFEQWKDQHVFEQKQKGWFAVKVRVPLGDFTSDQARSIAEVVKNFSGNELTLTIDQNLVIRHVPEVQLDRFYYLLKALEMDKLGFGSLNDITACPGTDTCNLGIANSTALSTELDQFLIANYPEYINREDLTIKISGCMNSCGQHMIASIGFQGMSIRTPDKTVIPAVQVLLGGGTLGDGQGRFADKVIKIPTKRALVALDKILSDYEDSDVNDFLEYYDSRGERYFYELLKPLTELENLTQDDYIDWGQSVQYVKEIGVGECAGVVIDLVATLFTETEEKFNNAENAIEEGLWGDAMYHAYSSAINTAKALLISEKKRTNSHHAIIHQFQDEFVETGQFPLVVSFPDFIGTYQTQRPTEEIAREYLESIKTFNESAQQFRAQQLEVV